MWDQSLAADPPNIDAVGELVAYWLRRGDEARAEMYRRRLMELGATPLR